MVFIVIFISQVILVQARVMPWFIRIEGQRLRTQVDAQATQLREQLDRVEAQQRSMTESVVTLKSFALDKSAPGDTDPGEKVSTSRQFFNSLVKEIGERLGGRAWMVDDTGRIIGDAAGAPTVQSLKDASLPMAVPLRWLLAIDVPTRRLGERPGILLHDAELQIADSSGALVQLASLAYSHSMHNQEGVFAVESRNLASRCTRSSKELRALVDDAMMQAQSGGPSVTQNNSVLIEEVFTVANTLFQRTGS